VVKAKSTRIRYINWLRIAAIYTVVAAHIAIWTAEGQEPLNFAWWVGNAIHILAIWTVPVFLMVSGVLLLDNRRDESAIDFYKKRMHRIGVPVVFWTVVYIVARRYIGHEQLTPRYVGWLIFTVTPYYHLWYLLMIPGVYLLTPPLRVFVRRANRKQRVLAIAVILGLAIVYYPLNVLYLHWPRTIFTIFLPYVGYYLCGHELALQGSKPMPRWPWVVLVVLSIGYAVLMAGPFVDNLGYVGDVYVVDFFAPPVILMALLIFRVAYSIEQRWQFKSMVFARAEAWITSTTLGIYVLHPLVLEYMREKMSHRAADEGLFVALTVGPIIAFGVSYILTSLMMNVPFLRRTVS